ncbi:MAG: response regulator transcription factor [Verrucomicrobia bacterium]|nr:MAG: response regulator transcription factor [Verrucomicrobiota bacterium]
MSTLPKPTDPRPIRVLIVDDHRVVRIGLRTLLDDTPDISVDGEAADGAAAVAEAARLRPHVVILDIRLPDRDGFTVCRQLKDQDPGIRVLILTSVADDRLILQAIGAGADGYLMKAIEEVDVAEAVRTVASGRAMLDPVVTRRLMDQLSRENGTPGGRLATLSPQELRVIELVALGKTNKEIGVTLQLSAKTVRNYLSTAFEKLHVARRSEAAVLYVRLGSPGG